MQYNRPCHYPEAIDVLMVRLYFAVFFNKPPDFNFSSASSALVAQVRGMLTNTYSEQLFSSLPLRMYLIWTGLAKVMYRHQSFIEMVIMIQQTETSLTGFHTALY